MPPLAGCIQAAMVLKDNYFEGMKLSDWQSSLRPKIQGSWNLHRLLPTGLDFFILLSSLVGIVGQPAQANYSTGNAFQDALARERVLAGQKCVSLDLGPMADEGVLAEDADLARTLDSFGWFETMSMQDLESLLEYYCDPKLGIFHADSSQIIGGLRTPAAMRAKGFDSPSWASDPLFKNLTSSPSGASASPNDSAIGNYGTALQAAAKPEDAAAVVVDALTAKISTALGIPVIDVDASKPVHVYGVDSLVAVELKNWFANYFRADIPVLHILSNMSMEELVLKVAQESSYTTFQ